MEDAEIRKLAALEHDHWWYRERRSILSRELRRLPTSGYALDIGTAAGGNTRVLRAHGWQVVALDYSETAVKICRRRDIDVLRADARKLPVKSNAFDLVLAMDVLEHIVEDDLVAAEIARVLKPGGIAMISVPCDMALWSAHDEATGHLRRYSRSTLAGLVEQGGLIIDRISGWNVLLRPIVKFRRRSATGSELTDMNSFVNSLLWFVVIAERYLPTTHLPGVSLILRATLPTRINPPQRFVGGAADTIANEVRPPTAHLATASVQSPPPQDGTRVQTDASIENAVLLGNTAFEHGNVGGRDLKSGVNINKRSVLKRLLRAKRQRLRPRFALDSTPAPYIRLYAVNERYQTIIFIPLHISTATLNRG